MQLKNRRRGRAYELATHVQRLVGALGLFERRRDVLCVAVEPVERFAHVALVGGRPLRVVAV